MRVKLCRGRYGSLIARMANGKIIVFPEVPEGVVEGDSVEVEVVKESFSYAIGKVVSVVEGGNVDTQRGMEFDAKVAKVGANVYGITIPRRISRLFDDLHRKRVRVKITFEE